MLKLESTGHISARLQVSVWNIQDAAEALDIEPAAAINDVLHYDSDDVDKMRQFFAEGKHDLAGLAAKQNARAKAKREAKQDTQS